MLVPSGMTEAELLAKIEHVTNTLAYDYTFGYYDVDDIKQEAFIIAMKCLKKYDESRPLENLLYVHIKNRLNNLIRDKYHRNDPPCKKCHLEIDGKTSHADGRFCDKYLAWKNRNANKSHLVSPHDICNIDDTVEKNTKIPDTVSDNIAKEEIFNLIDLKLPCDMRADYLKMRAGLTIPKVRRDNIINTIRQFLTDDEIEDIYS